MVLPEDPKYALKKVNFQDNLILWLILRGKFFFAHVTFKALILKTSIEIKLNHNHVYNQGV